MGNCSLLSWEVDGSSWEIDFKAWLGTGDLLVQSTIKHDGTYALVMDMSGGSSFAFHLRAPSGALLPGGGPSGQTGTKTPYYGQWWRMDTEPAAEARICLVEGAYFSDGVYFELVENPTTHKIGLHLVGSGTYAWSDALSTATFNFWEVRVWQSSTSPLVWTAELRINGVAKGTVDKTTGCADDVIHQFTVWQPAGVKCYADSGYFSDTAYFGSTDGFELGTPDFPDAEGYYTDWTASAGTKEGCVDEFSWDDDTDYITCSVGTPFKSQTFTHTQVGGYKGAAAIKAVVIWAKCKVQTAGSMFKRMGRSNTTDVLSGAVATSHWTWELPICLDLNPDGGIAWTEAAVDAFQIGMQSYYGSNPRGCTTLCIMVARTPAAGGGQIKKLCGVDWASVKKYAGVAEASIKSISGVAAQ